MAELLYVAGSALLLGAYRAYDDPKPAQLRRSAQPSGSLADLAEGALLGVVVAVPLGIPLRDSRCAPGS